MVDIKFKGDFEFESKTVLKEALKEVKEFILEEDKSIQDSWAESHEVQGLSVIININLGCPQDDFLSYEGIIEILSEYASNGLVEGWRDDYAEGDVELYIAGAGYEDESE